MVNCSINDYRNTAAPRNHPSITINKTTGVSLRLPVRWCSINCQLWKTNYGLERIAIFHISKLCNAIHIPLNCPHWVFFSSQPGSCKSYGLIVTARATTTTVCLITIKIAFSRKGRAVKNATETGKTIRLSALLSVVNICAPVKFYARIRLNSAPAPAPAPARARAPLSHSMLMWKQ